LVSQPDETAIFIAGGAPTLIDPNTVMKIKGNNSEKTMEVGLLKVASKLYLDIVNAARS
jgi:hypothetical protein